MAETKSSDEKDSGTKIIYCGNCGTLPVIVPSAPLCSICYMKIKMEKGFDNIFIKQTDAAYAAINLANCGVCKIEPVLCNSETCKKCLDKEDVKRSAKTAINQIDQFTTPICRVDAKINIGSVIQCGMCLK